MPKDPQVRSLRLEAQDTALSRLERGFESPRERHTTSVRLDAVGVILQLNGSFHDLKRSAILQRIREILAWL